MLAIIITLITNKKRYIHLHIIKFNVIKYIPSYIEQDHVK